jgi:putative transcriptional regulator
MPIVNNLRFVMAEKRIDNVSELINITGLSRNVLNKLWHNEDLESLKIGTLIVACDKLKINLSDLIEYTQDEN